LHVQQPTERERQLQVRILRGVNRSARFIGECLTFYKSIICIRDAFFPPNKKRRHKTRTIDLWNTRRETQIQTKLDQPPRKNGQHQTLEIRPHLQTPGKKEPRTPQETMATHRCRNRSNDLIHGGR